MIIKIDIRENELYNECMKHTEQYCNITIEKISIPVGDIILCDSSNNELAIIERKTLSDLACSIKDGRYAEQSFRLNYCELHNHNIYYLIEGNLDHYNQIKSRMDKNSIISSFITISYAKGFSLHKTNNICESAKWVLTFAEKIRKNKLVSHYDSNKDSSKETYANVSSRVKKENITTSNIDIIMLSQIPCVSTTVATAIINKYQNIFNLIQTLKTNTNEIYILTTQTKNGKLRKIPKNSIANILKYLHISENI
tara:strand:+ start:15860 stop:16621 length:762 start_codon:yes stop_codon:yes gene_type:complete